jgi:protein gp37
MSGTSQIEWTDATWNPVTGCAKVSPGCDRCYAETFAERWRNIPGHPYEHGFDLTLRPERLTQPLHWHTPRRVFVNSMSDLFHPGVPAEFIAAVFAVMAATPQHTYQILTKRHARMRSLLTDTCPRRCGRGCAPGEHFRAVMAWQATAHNPQHVPGLDTFERFDAIYWTPWPLPNVWLGVSVENDQWASIRIPTLLDTPAAVRFLSCEPLLGPLDLSPWLPCPRPAVCGEMPRGCCECAHPNNTHTIGGTRSPDWVIVGGESGHGARPMHPSWARGLRDQCVQAGVPLFFKQWGSWTPDLAGPGRCATVHANAGEDPLTMRRTSKTNAGRVLDGRTWDGFPDLRGVS